MNLERITIIPRYRRMVDTYTYKKYVGYNPLIITIEIILFNFFFF